jgi:hypothetical protein
VNRYFPFYPSLSIITSPLARATGKRIFDWSAELQRAFERTKKVFEKSARLAIPDPDGHYILETDASGIGLGACLLQSVNGVERIIGYFSKALDDAQQRYDSHKLELYALYQAIRHFAVYLSFVPCFTVRTDNQALRWWKKSDYAPGDVRSKWKSYLDPFRFNIEHLPGTSNTIADAISRAPLTVTSTVTMPSQMAALAPANASKTRARSQPDVAANYNEEHRLMIENLRGTVLP